MKYNILILLMIFTLPLVAQNEPTKSESATIQPTIMVIPFTKKSQDVRRTLDNNKQVRIAITLVKESFDNRGFTTVDFSAKLKEMELRAAFTSDNPSDIKTEIVRYSGADIYIEVDAQMVRDASGNSAQVILTGYDASTGNSLSNKVGFSNKFYTEDFGKLTAKAVEKISEDFLNVIQSKFSEIIENGRFVAVEFAIGGEDDLTMSSEVGEDELPLADMLELWMEENAYKGYYHIQGATDLKVIFDQVRIPIKDSKKRNYTSNKFALDIYKSLKKFKTIEGDKLSVKKSVKGNTIFITLSL
jgi:hypothetical protein